jgi:restriction endonuclease S subunit
MEEHKSIDELVIRVDERNIDESISELIGVSIDKCFIKSVANVNGTDLSKYKIIRKDDFAVSLMQVSRDGKIPVARMIEYDVAIMSPAYPIFRVKDKNIILPAYLDMWFKRPEFDREAAFIAVGGVRGSMPWEEFAKMKLPVPDIDKQKKIVEAYEAITNRIELKQKINDNLVAVGMASIRKNVGRCALINLTEAEMDSLTLPDNFKVQTISEFCADTKSGSTPSRTNNEYWDNGTIPWIKSGEVHNNITLQTEEHITHLGLNESSTKLLPKDTVLMAMYGVTAGEVGYLAIEATTNQAICGMNCHSKADAAYLYFTLIQSQAAISRLSNGGAQDNLNKNFIDNIKIVVPPSGFIEKLNLATIIKQMTLNTKEMVLLEELQSTVLAQLLSR